MWFFGSEAFLSIVQHKTDPAILVVRARRPRHIQKMFPGVKVLTLDGRDYQFRAELPREVVAERMQRYVMEMTATNFKASVKEKIYHDACMGVWSCMERIQPKPAYSQYSRKNSQGNMLFPLDYTYDHRPANFAKSAKGKRNGNKKPASQPQTDSDHERRD